VKEGLPHANAVLAATIAYPFVPADRSG